MAVFDPTHHYTSAFVTWSNLASIVKNREKFRFTGETAVFPLGHQMGPPCPPPLSTFQRWGGFFIFYFFWLCEWDCTQAVNCGWFPNTQPWNKTKPMYAKACRAEEGRGRCISLCVKQQGCYHALTCLQKRGGSQICGGAAASGVFQARHGARAAEAVITKGPLHIHNNKRDDKNHNAAAREPPSSAATQQQQKHNNDNSFISFHRIRLWTLSLPSDAFFFVNPQSLQNHNRCGGKIKSGSLSFIRRDTHMQARVSPHNRDLHSKILSTLLQYLLLTALNKSLNIPAIFTNCAHHITSFTPSQNVLVYICVFVCWCLTLTRFPIWFNDAFVKF